MSSEFEVSLVSPKRECLACLHSGSSMFSVTSENLRALVTHLIWRFLVLAVVTVSLAMSHMDFLAASRYVSLLSTLSFNKTWAAIVAKVLTMCSVKHSISVWWVAACEPTKDAKWLTCFCILSSLMVVGIFVFLAQLYCDVKFLVIICHKLV